MTVFINVKLLSEKLLHMSSLVNVKEFNFSPRPVFCRVVKGLCRTGGRLSFHLESEKAPLEKCGAELLWSEAVQSSAEL